MATASPCRRLTAQPLCAHRPGHVSLSRGLPPGFASGLRTPNPRSEEAIIDLLTVLRVLVRRFYIVIPVLVIGGATATSIAQDAEPVYTSSASVILLPQTPVVEEPQAPANPYMDFNSSLVMTAQVLAEVHETDATGRSAATELTVEAADRLPTLTITATGPSRDAVTGSVTAVMERLGTTLDGLQERAGVPATQRIRSSVLAEPAVPEASTSHVTRAVVMIAALALFAAVSLALVVESLAGSWRARMGEAPVSTGAGKDTPTRRPDVAAPVVRGAG